MSDEEKRQDFTVEWQFDAVGETPFHAAWEAWMAMRSKGSMANVFDVHDDSGECHRVDLQELMDRGVGPNRSMADAEAVEVAKGLIDYLWTGQATTLIVSNEATVTTEPTGEVFVQAWVRVKRGTQQ